MTTGHHYITVRRTDGLVTNLECPACGAVDEIALVDVITEWRPLYVKHDGDILIDEDNNAEGVADGYICMTCSTRLDFAPGDDAETLLTYF